MTNFSRVSIKDVERMVGRTADHVEVRNRWVTCFFYGRTGTEKSPGTADVTVSFKKW